MQNLNLAINVSTHKKLFLLTTFTLVISLFAVYKSYSQTSQSLPPEFANLSVNSRAIEKKFDFIVDKNSSNITQNLNLDKTGVILHLQTSPKIKDNNTKLKLLSSDNELIDVLTFKDTQGFFNLIDPSKSYSILQEIMSDCNELIKKFNLNQENTICPDSQTYKLLENIMITTDTSFKINLFTPIEFYKVNLSLPNNLQKLDSDFKTVGIKNNEASINTINLANLLMSGEFCFVSSTKVKNPIKSTDCFFSNKNIQVITSFFPNNKDNLSQNLELVFPYIFNTFNKQNHEYLLKYNENFQGSNEPQEVNKDSKDKLFLESYNFNLVTNLGRILTPKTRVKKNIYSLNNSIALDQILNKITFNIPQEKLEAIINPFTDTSIDSVLTKLILNSQNSFSLSIDNNIVPKDLLDPEIKKQTTQNNLQISLFLPANIFDLILNRIYSSVEQTKAPSVDEKGKPIEVVNDKSRADLQFSKSFEGIDLTQPNANITLDINPVTQILNDKDFINQLPITGFLIPPDFRPVIEENYRATISFSMTLNLKNNNILQINYSDLKTKDESKFVNFFSFKFLPQGKYQASIKFDGNRGAFFKNAGVIKEIANKAL
ncbi:MAG: hypothetical protein HYY52_03265 [Candidatus Melainabacteria bacterium]|nr:hypothetical protein [Candidatus Melainabacteria bacterium]